MVKEILNEKSNDGWKDKKSKILSKIKTFYEHTVKYKLNPTKQSGSWIDTIRRTSSEIRAEWESAINPNTISRNISEDEYKEAYEDGLKKAYRDGNKQCKNNYEIYEEFPTIYEIANSAKVEDFITNNAKHPYVVDKLFKEWVDFDAYLESLTESDRESILMLENAIDYVSKEELVNFLKPDAPEIYKKAVIEYKIENTKEE